MDYVLSDLLGEVPNNIFFNGEGHPNFNGIFIEVARRIYRNGEEDFLIPSSDFSNDKLPNLSSFQRAVAKERERREGSLSNSQLSLSADPGLPVRQPR